jgi:serine/threonine-protein kinase
VECPQDSRQLKAIELDPWIGQLIADRYTIQSVIGSGGMGVVYKAKNEVNDRPVAIKMLHQHLVTDTDAIKQFHLEAQAVSKVSHPNTVQLWDFGLTESGQPYIVMDYFDGINLRKLIKSEGILSIARANHIFGQAADALAFAHNAGVVHRDLKPENIMIAAAEVDRVAVVDFGISSFATARTKYDGGPVSDIVGSPPYMSPEQCQLAGEIDERSDIYSIAIVLYEALSGKLPFAAKNALDMLDAHISRQPLPLRAAHQGLVSCEALSELLAKSLDKKPENRPQTMEQFREGLADAVRRDMIRLSSLKNRKSELDGSSTTSQQRIVPPAGAATSAGGTSQGVTTASQTVPADATPSALAPIKVADIVRSDTLVDAVAALPQDQLLTTGAETKRVEKNFLDKVFAAIGLGSSRKEEKGPQYVLYNCPHCGETVAPDISFCLECGRSLAQTQDFAAIRAAQGTFTLPKTQHVEPGPTGFGRKKKARMTVRLWNSPTAIIVGISIIAVTAFVMTGGMETASKQLKKMHLKQIVGPELAKQLNLK